MKLRLIGFILLALTPLARGQSTIDSANRFAHGANVGWMDWRADATSGAVIGEYVCSGFIYAANIGWLNLGTARPANGIRYQNNSAIDFGVNHDGLGNLRGYAYGANVGWISFEDSGAPKVDLQTGRLSGFIYGANIGWISLGNAVAFVQTDAIAPGADSDGDGIADAFEYQFAGNLGTMNAVSDFDRDGFTDLEEYLAGTDPTNPADSLKIIQFIVSPSGANVTLTWLSRPTRRYFIEKRADFGASNLWLDSGLGLLLPDGGTTTRFLSGGTNPGYFRIKAVRPLTP